MVSRLERYCYLGAYFLLNLVLTVLNKIVLQQFSYPYLLTAFHACFAGMGCLIMKYGGTIKIRPISLRQMSYIGCFSSLYTLNIATSNASLNIVSIPFHQVVRATTPVFTALIYALFFGRKYSFAAYSSLVPVVVGVGFATYGDYHTSTWGLILTIVGAFLAAVKTVTTNQLQTGTLQLSAYELLYYLSPCAAMQGLIYSIWNGEAADLQRLAFAERALSLRWANVLLMNGLTACILNIVSFRANKRVGALTMTVAAQLKQMAIIVLGIVLFRISISWTNLFGIIMTIVGGALYARLELNGFDRSGMLLPY